MTDYGQTFKKKVITLKSDGNPRPAVLDRFYNSPVYNSHVRYLNNIT